MSAAERLVWYCMIFTEINKKSFQENRGRVLLFCTRIGARVWPKRDVATHAYASMVVSQWQRHASETTAVRIQGAAGLAAHHSPCGS